MTDLTPEGQRLVQEMARRHDMSEAAVRAVLEAMAASGGGMAQFSHPDLGGMGQWSRGGMLMIGDMFNHGLKARVDALCRDLSEAAARPGVFVDARPTSGRTWWPDDLGTPSSTGAQNSMRYAYFPDRRRLVLDDNGWVSVYDTGDHAIAGFSQQQSSAQSVRFASQHGPVSLDDLRLL